MAMTSSWPIPGKHMHFEQMIESAFLPSASTLLVFCFQMLPVYKSVPAVAICRIHQYNVIFLEWIVDSARASISNGVDTFIFQNGLITLQTVRNTVVPKT
jgi:hypothetical protein